MSAILYGIIHNRAKSTYSGPKVTAANYQLWINHWFHTAYTILDEFSKEDLPATEDAIRNIIKEQVKLLRREEKEALEKAH